MKARKLVFASTLIAASFPALAVGTPENMVISASSHIELAGIYDNLHPTTVTERPSTVPPALLCAGALPYCVVPSAKDFVELATIGATISSSREAATDDASMAKFTPQTWSVDRSMYMQPKIAVVGDALGSWGG
jgi:hypothetical protein